MNVLGIETSCDETACAIFNEVEGIVSEEVYSQIALHAEYGGVVPELASRDHIKKLTPLIKNCLAKAKLTPDDIDGIAYTKGPGLIGALMVGAAVAKSLAFAWKKPCIGIHHMEAHLMAVMLSEPKPAYPFVALLVSGGHTQLVEVKGFRQYRLLGETVDDAVGEAFDKTAKLLGLPYPGGPELEQLAKQGHPSEIHFPRPMLHTADVNFSFSGIKTHAAMVVRALPENRKADIAFAFQEAVVETLAKKSKKALDETGLSRLVVVGGVSANKRLREELAKYAELFCPERRYCTDNGAMVAYAGYLHFQKSPSTNYKIEALPRFPMSESET